MPAGSVTAARVSPARVSSTEALSAAETLRCVAATPAAKRMEAAAGVLLLAGESVKAFATVTTPKSRRRPLCDPSRSWPQRARGRQRVIRQRFGDLRRGVGPLLASADVARVSSRNAPSSCRYLRAFRRRLAKPQSTRPRLSPSGPSSVREPFKITLAFQRADIPALST